MVKYTATQHSFLLAKITRIHKRIIAAVDENNIFLDIQEIKTQLKSITEQLEECTIYMMEHPAEGVSPDDYSTKFIDMEDKTDQCLDMYSTMKRNFEDTTEQASSNNVTTQTANNLTGTSTSDQQTLQDPPSSGTSNTNQQNDPATEEAPMSATRRTYPLSDTHPPTQAVDPQTQTSSQKLNK